MPKCILIADDNEVIRRSLRFLFRQDEDWKICAEAVNGRDAVEKAQQLHPDLVVLDFAMPVMNGLEAASQLKQGNPMLPIVMLTAFKDRFLEEKAYEAGVSLILSKSDDANRVVNFARILLKADSGTTAGNEH